MFNYSTFFKPEKNGEFETDIEIDTPKAQEIAFLADQNRKCNYYYLGLAKCRDHVLEKSSAQNSPNYKHGFLPCKEILDAHYSCMTNKKYGRFRS